MKKILFLLLLLVPVGLFAQMIPFEMGAIKVDSIYMNESTDWWDEINVSTKLAGATNSQVPTALAVRTFVMDTVPQMIADSIDAIDLSTTALQDSIDTHTDTLQSHNARIKVLSDTTAAHNTRIKTNKNSITSVLDSVATHQDTLQLHNTRIKVLESTTGGAGDVEISGSPAVKQLATWTDATTITGDPQIIADTNTISINGWMLWKHTNAGFYFRYSGTDYLTIQSTYFGGTAVNSAQVQNFNSLGTSSPSFTWLSDNNTGLSHTAADRLNLVTGGGNRITVYNDSVAMNEPTRFKDTTYYDYLEAKTQYGWLYMDSALHSIRIDSSIINASFGLTMELPTLKEQLGDRKNGEIGWYISPTEKVYGFERSTPRQAIRALMSEAEMDKRRILELQENAALQEDRIKKLETDVELLKAVITKYINEQ